MTIQHRRLVVSAKEEPAFLICQLCQEENYYHSNDGSSFAKQMLLNAKWVITPTTVCVSALMCVPY